MKNVRYNTFAEIHRPSVLSLADVELDKINTALAELVRGIELRKRAYYVNMTHIVYIIGMPSLLNRQQRRSRNLLGGYLFDPVRKERRTPPNDWKWNIDEKKLEKIPSIPGDGRINFGIAANNGRSSIVSYRSGSTSSASTGKMIVVGGNTILNKYDFPLHCRSGAIRWICRPTGTCYVYGQSDDQWETLPCLPNPLCGEQRSSTIACVAS